MTGNEIILRLLKMFALIIAIGTVLGLLSASVVSKPPAYAQLAARDVRTTKANELFKYNRVIQDGYVVVTTFDIE